MKILSTQQIREADAYTIEHEPISSIDLMERAAEAFTEWFKDILYAPYFTRKVAIVCGTGNNGGDGIAIARMLGQSSGYEITVFIVKYVSNSTPDFDTNLERLFNNDIVKVNFVKEGDAMPDFKPYDIIIDALVGSGLNREPQDLLAEIITAVNDSEKVVFSVDIPSGMFADKETTGVSIEADFTLTFEVPKYSFFFAENETRLGEWEVKSIGLHQEYFRNALTSHYYVDRETLIPWIKKRTKFSHKGNYGHALLIAGSKGKMGACVLASRACIRSGSGLVTAHIPEGGVDILQISVPEVMASIDVDIECFTRILGFDKYDVIGIGPGIGTRNKTRNALCYLLKNTEKPMVLDADALNILADTKEWLEFLPKNSILTPHPKEFERLFGSTENSFERHELQRKKAVELGCVILLKGAFTTIASPEGECYFNSTGNPGMATAGSGDVLTGILTGLLAQGYEPLHAAVLGVYLHGLSGDLSSASKTETALISGDLIRYLPAAMMELGM